MQIAVRAHAAHERRQSPVPLRTFLSASRVVALAVCCLSTLSAAPQHVTLLRAAGAAVTAGDGGLALAKLNEAAKLRPDYPRIQINIARVAAALGQKDEAIAALDALAAMGLRMNAANDRSFAALPGDPRFDAVAARLAAGPGVVGSDRAGMLSIAGVTGIIECCMHDPKSGAWYFGDVRNRCIWRSGPGGGALKKFTKDADVLDGVFRIALSADRKTIWAATATVGAMIGTDAVDGKRSGLVAIDAESGRVRARYATPDNSLKHLIGDLLVTDDGAVIATDSLSPVIWRLAPGSKQLMPWFENDEFLSLQGIAVSTDGRVMYVADYANGIWRIDLGNRTPSLLIAPKNATFFGIDGIVAVPGGLLAVQNGVNPQRVLFIEPSESGPSTAHIVACDLPAMTDLALGQIDGDSFHFVADSGWSLFDPVPANPPAARAVTVISIPVE